MTHLDEEQEEPLDPKLEYIRRRMIRLLLVSIGILFAGLIAVFAAIIYRVNSNDTAKPSSPVSEIPGSEAPAGSAAILSEFEISGPDGAKLLASQISGDRLLLSWELADGQNSVWIISLTSGEVISRISIE